MRIRLCTSSMNAVVLLEKVTVMRIKSCMLAQWAEWQALMVHCLALVTSPCGAAESAGSGVLLSIALAFCQKKYE